MLGVIGDCPSIYDLVPLELGGPIARTGYLYQDHVAARFCIQMFRDPQLAEVWCEALDDITLIWRDAGLAAVEFVQVKAEHLGQIWSVALLCSGGAASIVGRSLAQHRCGEPCWFRVVTRIGVGPELKVLPFKRKDQARCLGNAGTLMLHQAIGKHLDGLYSPAGWSPSNWLQHAHWDVTESEAALEVSNLSDLELWLEDIGEHLLRDQREELYNRILVRVIRASALTHDPMKQKRLIRDPYLAWALSEVYSVRGQVTKGGKNLVGKMEHASIPSSAIENANELRLAYRKRMLDPKYQQAQDHRSAELEVTAVLQELVARLDANLLSASGPVFHARCLGAVASVQAKYPNVDLSYLHGSMYSMADRCRLRFSPAAVP
jgi:hypothetical protein